MALLRLRAAASRVPALLDALRVLWLVPHRLLAAFAVCSTAAAASVLSAWLLMASAASVVERAARAGDDLYPLMGFNQGRRATPTRRVRLTERDLRLMALLLDVRFLSTSQLVLLGFGPCGMRAGQRRLKLLHGGGFVDRFRPPRGAGSSEWTYRVAARGFKELAAVQMTAGSRRYVLPPIKVSSVRHDLELAALVLRVALDAGGELTAGLIDSMRFEWRGPRRGHIERRGDELRERSPAETLASGTPPHPKESHRGALRCDATLIGGSPGRRFVVLIEYDSSWWPEKHVGRLRRYESWLRDGWRRTGFATHAVAPTVLALAAREELVRPLLEAADRVLGAGHGREEDGSRAGPRPAREQIVFASREQLMSGDWTVQRVPSLPPSLREKQEVCSARSHTYELPLQFSCGASPPAVKAGAGYAADVATTLENE